jgi:hypothetical protein
MSQSPRLRDEASKKKKKEQQREVAKEVVTSVGPVAGIAEIANC